MKRIVLDTNCLLISLSKKGDYYKVWRDFFAEKYILCYTNDILTEYEEILSLKIGKEIAQNIIKAIITRKNTLKLGAEILQFIPNYPVNDSYFTKETLSRL